MIKKNKYRQNYIQMVKNGKRRGKAEKERKNDIK